MPPIDYETEYDNRGRVPEHPEIFERWAREAAAYRAAASDAEFALAYGPSPRQIIDLFPAKDDDEMTPLLRGDDAATACQRLVDAANQRGTLDNLTAAVLRVLDGPGRPEASAGLGARIRSLFVRRDG